MSEKTAVSGCIVNYNGGEEILRCIRSLFAHTAGVDFTLFISDNHSTDGSLEKIREEFPQVTVLAGESNVGFGAGHNRAIPYLQSSYHVIINPDIELTRDAVTELVRYMEDHPEVGMVMPDILNPDGTRQELPKKNPNWFYLIGGRLPFGKAIRRSFCRTDEHLSEPTEIQFVSGCFSLIRTDVFRKLGGYDERYFLYMEDADLSREVGRAHKLIFNPETQVVHAWHRASGRNLKALKLHIHSAWQYFKKWRREKR